jgi:LmbE family N-acetylglucosaminyl deacetylase
VLSIRLGGHADDLRVVLCLGAHCDDIEIGCGGTLLRLMEEYPGLSVHWVVFSSTPLRAEEARLGAQRFLSGAGEKLVTIHDFADGFFPYHGAAIKECFESLKRDISPNLIFTHYRHDLHQDHRIVSELTWNTFRDHLILEYEIPKYDGDFGSPGLFTVLPESVCTRKIDIIISCYNSQSGKRWLSQDLFMSTLRLRGLEANSPTGLAEGFYCRKAVL